LIESAAESRAAMAGLLQLVTHISKPLIQGKSSTSENSSSSAALAALYPSRIESLESWYVVIVTAIISNQCHCFHQLRFDQLVTG